MESYVVLLDDLDEAGVVERGVLAELVHVAHEVLELSLERPRVVLDLLLVVIVPIVRVLRMRNVLLIMRRLARLVAAQIPLEHLVRVPVIGLDLLAVLGDLLLLEAGDLDELAVELLLELGLVHVRPFRRALGRRALLQPPIERLLQRRVVHVLRRPALILVALEPRAEFHDGPGAPVGEVVSSCLLAAAESCPP